MEEFIKKIEDLYKRSLNKNIITYTGFLTPAEKQIILNRFGADRVVFSGGVENAERVRAFFLPDYMEIVPKEEYITALKATFSFKKLEHRDFLGSLLSLGIERKCLGDIYVFEKEAYFFITKDIASCIKGNFSKVGNVGIKLSEVSFDNVKTLKPSFEEISFTVSSLRLDSIVAGSIKESREKANKFIKDGAVLLNYLVCDNPSKQLDEADVFSIKRYGKFKLDTVGGLSKRGKRYVTVKKFI